MYKHSFKRFLYFTLSLIGLVVISPLLVVVDAVGGFAGFSADTPSMIEYAGIEMKEFPMGVTTILGKKNRLFRWGIL